MIDLTGKRIGLYGGTFDPFHNAHRKLIECALTQLPLDIILVMPLGQPPHKTRRISLAAHRFEMARLGTEGLQGVFVSDHEIRTPGIDYTLETVLRLKEQHCPSQVMLLAGSDNLQSIDSWYRVEDLLREVTFAVVKRGDDDNDNLADKARETAMRYGTRVIFFDMPPTTLASSDLRRHLMGHGELSGQCPDAVEAFIERQRLYPLSTVYSMIEDDDWERIIALEGWSWRFISQERRVHSASVAQYAAHLASIYAVDISKAMAGGLIHDMAKELEIEEQRELARSYLNDKAMLSSFTDELLHGPAAAQLVTMSGERDTELLDAIAFHSTGHGEMSVLGKIIYLSDKIAFDRPFSRLEPIRVLAESGKIDEAMKLCLEEVFDALERSGVELNALTRDAYHACAGGTC
ncbi:MAG TPA: nicotinate (nicotinamide) nucleotide adenylyltransferase [Clostridiaceae bacterium]|nr:nicotinate (nicotinamide) nucleotide adenylyltransferase [Clostridiaceae bacterium]